MGAIDPAAIAEALVQGFDYYHPPASLKTVIVEVASRISSADSELSLAERLLEDDFQDCLSRLLDKQEEIRKKGLFAPFEIVADGSEIVGFSYPRSGDSEHMRRVRAVAPQVGGILEALRALQPLEFEQLCARILALLRAREIQMTKYSRDEGIDFLGWLDLPESFLLEDERFPHFRSGFTMLVLGQAKRYIDHPVGVKEIRELVGAVAAFHHDQLAPWESKLQLNAFRLMVPILPLIMTTGSISRDAKKLARNCGVLTRDGAEIALFLGLEGIGLVEEPDSYPPRYRFDKERFLAWLHG